MHVEDRVRELDKVDLERLCRVDHLRLPDDPVVIDAAEGNRGDLPEFRGVRVGQLVQKMVFGPAQALTVGELVRARPDAVAVAAAALGVRRTGGRG